MIILTEDSTGRVVLCPAGSPTPREGWTASEADAESIPFGPGELRKQDGQLVRVIDEDKRISSIKREAQRRIVVLMGYTQVGTPPPPWVIKQINLAASALESVLPLLSAEQLAALAPIITLWTKIKAIRAHSNALELNPNAGPWPE